MAGKSGRSSILGVVLDGVIRKRARDLPPIKQYSHRRRGAQRLHILTQSSPVAWDRAPKLPPSCGKFASPAPVVSRATRRLSARRTWPKNARPVDVEPDEREGRLARIAPVKRRSMKMGNTGLRSCPRTLAPRPPRQQPPDAIRPRSTARAARRAAPTVGAAHQLDSAPSLLRGHERTFVR